MQNTKQTIEKEGLSEPGGHRKAASNSYVSNHNLQSQRQHEEDKRKNAAQEQQVSFYSPAQHDYNGQTSPKPQPPILPGGNAVKFYSPGIQH